MYQLMSTTPFEVVRVDRLDTSGDRTRHACLTCHASVRPIHAWRVTYRIAEAHGRVFDGTVCARCARKLLVALQGR